jgi:hypothetical protein
MRGIPLLKKWSSQEGLCSSGLVNNINTSNFNMLAYLLSYLLAPWSRVLLEKLTGLILIYLLTAVELTPGGSSTVHTDTQTIHRTTQLTTKWEDCGPCPVFESYTLAFALQLRKKRGKTCS